ncbi:hypothetical protein DLAC_08342 [Tieghemostelium lacteum]|uniref:Transmembrane protein n=1 Tax=Tieghemostelium lacteum TaxID=361077 RepID=A0A151ZBT2_TIELA|nr:hypothetical protein DLAC_08342 [Tieghemostelium lacteum]|eukprot:KYQ91385.1 hypothetical protein DLAC_08342 [Tieghemostelium lacteum]
MELIKVIFLILLSLISVTLASGSESVHSSGILGGILAALCFGIIGNLTKKLAPKFIFSLLPYHSVSC